MSMMRRFDPFGEMLTLRDAMNQLVEEAFISPARMSTGGTLGMAMDMRETPDAFLVDAVLPGVRPEDVNITMQDNVLTITAETRQEQGSAAQQNSVHVAERHYGRFMRAVAIAGEPRGGAGNAGERHSAPRNCQGRASQATQDHGQCRQAAAQPDGGCDAPSDPK